MPPPLTVRSNHAASSQRMQASGDIRQVLRKSLNTDNVQATTALTQALAQVEVVVDLADFFAVAPLRSRLLNSPSIYHGARMSDIPDTPCRT